MNKILLYLVLCNILLYFIFKLLDKGCAIILFINIKTLIIVSIIILDINYYILVYILLLKSTSYLSLF